MARKFLLQWSSRARLLLLFLKANLPSIDKSVSFLLPSSILTASFPFFPFSPLTAASQHHQMYVIFSHTLPHTFLLSAVVNDYDGQTLLFYIHESFCYRLLESAKVLTWSSFVLMAIIKSSWSCCYLAVASRQKRVGETIVLIKYLHYCSFSSDYLPSCKLRKTGKQESEANFVASSNFNLMYFPVHWKLFIAAS